VSDDDQVLIISEQGMIIRFPVRGVRSMGRNTQGVRLINIEEGDRVVAAMKLIDKDQPEDVAAEIDIVEAPIPEPPTDDTVH
jgi:DNA gyrase subunit A